MNRRDFLNLTVRSTAAAAAMTLVAPTAFAASPLNGKTPINTATLSGGMRVSLYPGKGRKHYYAVVEHKGRRKVKTFKIKRGGRTFEQFNEGNKMQMRVGGQTFDLKANGGKISWSGQSGGGSGEAVAQGWVGVAIIVAIGLGALYATAGEPAEEASTAIETVTDTLGNGSGEVGEGDDDGDES